MIRQVMPSQVAQIIANNQPMTLEKIPYEIGTSYADDNVNKEECYWVSPSISPHSVFSISTFGADAIKRNEEILAWCVNSYGPRGIWGIDINNPDARWFASDRKFYFRHESDRTMFILRWE